jgi:hypothetical protein
VPYASFGDPQTLNLYAYVENAPINKVDADGHYAQATANAGAFPGLQYSACGDAFDSSQCVTDFLLGNQGSEEEIDKEDTMARIARQKSSVLKQ